MDYCLVVELAQAGASGGFHTLNSCPLSNSSRTQKIISLSSCEAELRAIVSSASDGICVRSVLEFALGAKVDHYIFTHSSSARQLDEERSWTSETFGWEVALG